MYYLSLGCDPRINSRRITWTRHLHQPKYCPFADIIRFVWIIIAMVMIIFSKWLKNIAQQSRIYRWVNLRTIHVTRMHNKTCLPIRLNWLLDAQWMFRIEWWKNTLIHDSQYYRCHHPSIITSAWNWEQHEADTKTLIDVVGEFFTQLVFRCIFIRCDRMTYDGDVSTSCDWFQFVQFHEAHSAS